MKTEINKKYGIVALLFTVCSAISLISAVAYLITSADGALYNVLALVWLVTIASGCVLAVFSHGPRWVSFVYLSCVILYALLHIVSSYLLMIAMGAMSADGMAYILLRGLPVCLIFASGCFMGIMELKKPRETVEHSLCVYTISAIMVIAAVAVTAFALSFAGVFYMASFEYWQFINPMTWLAIGTAAIAWKLAVNTKKTALRTCVGMVCGLLVLLNFVNLNVYIARAFATSHANEAEAAALHITDKKSEGTDTPDGKWGLFAREEVSSEYYTTPLSVPMMLCGNMENVNSVQVIKNAGNWHENSNDGVVLYFDAYLPANAAEKTPVIISMHGINAPRQYTDVLGQFSAMGYAVLDIEYGQDSERFHKATVNSPGDDYAKENYDAWVKDMEYLFRYLKTHEDSLNIDLQQTFLLGHSYGCWMSVGIDNLLHGAGYTDYNGNNAVARYDQLTDRFEGDAAAADVAEFVDIKGMMLLYGLNGRFFADGLDPIIFITGTNDHVVPYYYANQMYKLRSEYDIPDFYIMEAGVTGHGYDIMPGCDLSLQLTNRYLHMFVEKYSQ